VLNSRKYFHYLIDRAQQQFPGKSPDTKVKAVNYLLPHIHRVPSRIVRDELAAEVSQRLQIDSAVLRQELRSAASTRSQKMEVSSSPLGYSKNERLLLRALLGTAGDSPEEAAAIADEVASVLSHEKLHEGLSSEEHIASVLKSVERGEDVLLSHELSPQARTLFTHLIFQETNYLKDEGYKASADEVRKALFSIRRIRAEKELDVLQSRIERAKVSDPLELARLGQEKLKLQARIREMVRSMETEMSS
jgi:DNA primase